MAAAKGSSLITVPLSAVGGGGVCHLGEVGRYDRRRHRRRRHIRMKRYLTDGVRQLIGILMGAAAPAQVISDSANNGDGAATDD